MLVPADYTPAFLTGPNGCGTSDRQSPLFANCLAAISNDESGTSITGSSGEPVALSMFQAKLPNGQYMIPFADGQTPTPAFPENAIMPRHGLFHFGSGGR